MKKRTFNYLIMVCFLMLCFVINANAETWFMCRMGGGTWVDNHCVYPEMNHAPTSRTVKIYDYDEIVDSTWFNLGEDANNNVLAQYEHFGIYWQTNDLKYDKPVDIQLVIYIPKLNNVMLYVDGNGVLTYCPCWFYYNTKDPVSKTIFDEHLVSDVLADFEGWIGVAYQISNHDEPCYYDIHIQYVWIAKPNN